MSEVVDLADMNDIECKWWNEAMETVCQASFVWPWRERDQHLDCIRSLKWEMMSKEEQTRAPSSNSPQAGQQALQ
jgi:hypothetical protein